jgi:hypothetical protein
MMVIIELNMEMMGMLELEWSQDSYKQSLRFDPFGRNGW